MNPPRATADDYIAFLVATPGEGTATEMGRCQPTRPQAPSHDAFARHVGLVARFWSGRHRRVVQGINLVTALWTDGDALWPCDDRLVDKAAGDGTKSDQFRDMLRAAAGRGLKPRCVCFDCWYSGKDNLTAVRALGWTFVTQVRCNRKVNPDRTGNRAIAECDIAASGTVVHLEGFGLVRAFRIAATDGGTEHGITNDLQMDELARRTWAERAWGIEEFHRGLKPHTAADRCQTRMAKAQRNHIGFALRAFVRLEWHRFSTGVTWFAAKLAIIREAVRNFLAQPAYRLPTA